MRGEGVKRTVSQENLKEGKELCNLSNKKGKEMMQKKQKSGRIMEESRLKRNERKQGKEQDEKGGER
jgi:hypothetical protein